MKYRELIAKMTLREKASLCSGADFWNTKAIERLGIPGVMLTDGPHGVRKQAGKADHLGLNHSIPATCYPTASAAANSWNTDLLEKMGACLGLEAASEKVAVLLGPGVNIKRSPLCGRNFEYYSEDPFLAGKCAAAMIRGIQSNGISACVKHFAANSQEHYRMTTDSVLDERTLREIYLPAFEAAVREGGARCLMTSYNKVNGVYANENTHLVSEILRGEWGFRGLIVTDWGGSNDRVAGLRAGNHLEMPGSRGQTDRQIEDAVRQGLLDEALLDERVDVILDMVLSAAEQFRRPRTYDPDAHHAMAAAAAEECAVLLKNEDAILPLKPGFEVAVIGDFAAVPRYQGAGSSLINPTRLDKGLDALKACGVRVKGYARGFKRMGGRSRRLLREARKLAASADLALLWLGLDEGSEAEGVDRPDMKLPANQLELLSAIKAANPNIVVVLSCGSPVEMDWDKDTKAVLHAYLGGQAGATAIARLLTGAANPSGKLAETIPMKLADTPCAGLYPGPEATCEYREGIYVGYRFFDTAQVPVRYPFGFGLSYTRFAYSDLHASPEEVSFTVTNTGGRAGAEISQVYIAPKAPRAFRPAQELKGFAKTFLEPGESRRVRIALDERAFAYWNILKKAWSVESGAYEILVGSSSRDIRLRETLRLSGDDAPNPYEGSLFQPYREAHVTRVPDASFRALLGRPIPPALWDAAAPLTANSPVGQGSKLKGGLGRFLYNLVRFARRLLLLLGRKETANYVMFVMSLPYRSFARMTGVITEAQTAPLLKIINRQKGGWREFFRARGR